MIKLCSYFHKTKRKISKLPDNSIIVSDIAGDTLRLIISRNENELINQMKLLDFSLVTYESYKNDSSSPYFIELSANNENDKLEIIKKLISKGALFSYGHSWHPSEVLK
ncbi:hypothetical protein [Xenorhabdus szentirmaii]|uniref:Uncharacterized protein n=1 Tax=Xenorhabdus szentirmaii DSM 16338 TaxID=1427518 RepID=W1J3D4_9GAMM|nr:MULTISPECIES: hypothetical protein [Xenorhabdus]MBD2794342.1 hypothetical protein [Xenorhabdus sp. CUL]MBD2804785.1 hypothetical protein [Xenorhabdus sp. ZM]MBD2826630.1 hypothetical protein [Xenorhabdus sp. 5]PHM33841.1 hypothetical protein Xsze_00228 [Xenorhabdus szentirmaii DSM 16338]PHM42582.1 hypothetical protein Xszus_02321 [Xenorhabdus szentirmaii]